jgi:zinc protease
VETLTKHWGSALDLMADVALNPTFPEEELDRVRREHITDIRRAKDDGSFVAEQVMPGLLFGRDSAYGHPSFGTEEAVTGFTQGDLKSHYRRTYRPGMSQLIVVGDASLEEVVAKAEASFGAWSNDGPAESPEVSAGPEGVDGATTIYLVDKPGAAQSVIRAGHVTVPRKHPDYFSLLLLNHVFGGQFSARLNLNLRQDKGYSYGFHSSISWYSPRSMLTAGGSVQTDVTKESVVEVLKEFQDIHEARPVSELELAGARDGLLRGFPAGFERSGQVLGQLVSLLVHDLPDDYFRTVSGELAAVSTDQVQQAGAEQVHPEGLTLLVVGDQAVVEPGLRELGLPVVVLDREGQEIG